jgi:hypothetical protein
MLLAAVLVAAVSAEPLTWRDFPANSFPVPRQGTPTPRTERQREAFAKLMSRKRQPHNKKLIGRPFEGAAQVVTVKRTKDGKREAVAVELLAPGKLAGWRTHYSGNMVARRVAWIVDAGDTVAEGDELTVRGEVASVTVDDFHNAVEGANYEACDFVVTLHLAEKTYLAGVQQ